MIITLSCPRESWCGRKFSSAGSGKEKKMVSLISQDANSSRGTQVQGGYAEHQHVSGPYENRGRSQTGGQRESQNYLQALCF